MKRKHNLLLVVEHMRTLENTVPKSICGVVVNCEFENSWRDFQNPTYPSYANEGNKEKHIQDYKIILSER